MNTIKPRRHFKAVLPLLAAAWLLSAPVAQADESQDLSQGSWRFNAGDGNFASPSFNDAGWPTITVGSQSWGQQGFPTFYGYGWYRSTQVVPLTPARSGPLLKLAVNGTSGNQVFAYVNGTLVGSKTQGDGSFVVPWHLVTPGAANVIALRVFCYGQEAASGGYEPCGLTGAVQLQASSTSADSMPFKFSTDQVGNVTAPGVALSLKAAVSNSTGTTKNLSAKFTITRQETATVAQTTTATATLASGATATMAVPFSSTVRGPYSVSVALSDDTGAIKTYSGYSVGVQEAVASDDRFGVNVVGGQSVSAHLGVASNITYDLARRAGALWVREHVLPWSFVQQEPNLWNWGYYDGLKADADRTGRQILWDPLRVPYWSRGASAPNTANGADSTLQYPPTEPYHQAFANFLAAAARRYPGQFWEVTNEPDANPDRYSNCGLVSNEACQGYSVYRRLLEKAYVGIKSADPTATVLLGGLQSPDFKQLPWESAASNTWFDRLMNAGAKPFFDVMNYHSYSGNSGTTDDVATRAIKVKQIDESYGIGHRPLWVTETSRNGPGDTEIRWELTRNIVQQLGEGVAKSFYFDVIDYPDEALPWGLWDKDMNPRAQFFTFSTLVRFLAGRPTVTKTTIGAVPVYQFSNASSTVTPVWSDSGAMIQVPPGAAVYDDFGNPVTTSGSALTLTNRMMFLVQSGGVAASPPVNTGLPAISGSPVSGSTLNASTGSWQNAPTAYAYQWQRCNSSGSACGNVAGATGAGYLLGASDVGSTMRVRVGASNSSGADAATSAATAVITAPSANPPANTAAPTISGTAQENQTLTATTGAWTNNPSSYAYQWIACDLFGSCLDISGATASSYRLTCREIADRIKVRVRAANSAGSAMATSALTGNVSANTASGYCP